MDDDELPVSDRTKLRRHPERVRLDRAALHAILDDAPVAHVGFADGSGRPVVIPTTYARLGRTMYIHGAVASRMLRAGAEGVDLSVAVTVVDGLVLARSAFHHSMNYRSAVIFGRARVVTDADEKMRALAALVDRLVPARSEAARAPTPAELAATLVLALPLEEASVKVRTGPPIDDKADRAWPVWSGVVPLALRPGVPIPAVAPANVNADAGAGEARLSPPELTFAGAPAREGAAAAVEARHGDFVVSDDRTRVDVPRVTAWLASEYWAPGVPAWVVERSMRGSAVVAGAYAAGSGEQVGFLRVVSDGARIAFLMDVFVAPAQRGRGLGHALVRFALEHPDLRSVARWLLGTRDAHGLYAAHGFGPFPEPHRLMLRLGPPGWGRD